MKKKLIIIASIVLILGLILIISGIEYKSSTKENKEPLQNEINDKVKPEDIFIFNFQIEKLEDEFQVNFIAFNNSSLKIQTKNLTVKFYDKDNNVIYNDNVEIKDIVSKGYANLSFNNSKLDKEIFKYEVYLDDKKLNLQEEDFESWCKKNNIDYEEDVKILENKFPKLLVLDLNAKKQKEKAIITFKLLNNSNDKLDNKKLVINLYNENEIVKTIDYEIEHLKANETLDILLEEDIKDSIQFTKSEIVYEGKVLEVFKEEEIEKELYN